MEVLNYYNSILLAPLKHLTARKKRGLINGIGNIANSLFGILDQQFAKKYQKDIESIQNNENYLLELVKNQISVVELENQILRKTEDNINKQLSMIGGFMNQTDVNFAMVESTVEIMMATAFFNSASLATYLLLKNMRTMQEMLFDSLTDVYQGHMDVHLLSPIELMKQLDMISGRLPKSLNLPVNNPREDIKDIYKLLYVKARVTSNYFLFEVHVPLISDDEFSLYRAVPLPMKTESKTITVLVQSQYVAVNFLKDKYISITENDIKMCIQLKERRYICYKNLPVFNLHNRNAPCEALLLSHGVKPPCDVRKTNCDDAWIALHSPNSWLAICCGACTLRTICDTDVTSHIMTTSSIVTMAQGCILQSKDTTIYSHNEYNTNMKLQRQYEVPRLNSSVNNIVDLTYHNSLLSGRRETIQRDTQEIEKKLFYLHEHEVLPSPISSHDIHQYIICYTLFGAALLACLVWIIRKRNLLCCKPGAVQDEDIELQHQGMASPMRRATRAAPKQAPAPQPHAAPSTAMTAAANNVAFNLDD